MRDRYPRAMAALYSKRYRDALDDAAKLHRRQVRKGTDVPYVSHLLHVSALVWESGGTEDQAIAALLHDAVEDQGGAKVLRKIRERYGKHVSRMVWACTDSSTPKTKRPWVERKTRHLAALADAGDDALLVVAADKVVNVESIVGDLQQHGRNGVGSVQRAARVAGLVPPGRLRAALVTARCGHGARPSSRSRRRAARGLGGRAALLGSTGRLTSVLSASVGGLRLGSAFVGLIRRGGRGAALASGRGASVTRRGTPSSGG